MRTKEMDTKYKYFRSFENLQRKVNIEEEVEPISLILICAQLFLKVSHERVQL